MAAKISGSQNKNHLSSTKPSAIAAVCNGASIGVLADPLLRFWSFFLRIAIGFFGAWLSIFCWLLPAHGGVAALSSSSCRGYCGSRSCSSPLAWKLQGPRIVCPRRLIYTLLIAI